MAIKFEKQNRLKAMIAKELQVEQLEAKIVKMATKFDNKITPYMDLIKQQRSDFEKLNAQMINLRKDIENRYQLNQAVRAQLTDAAERNDALQAQLIKMKNERHELMGCVRILSEATNTYINREALPERIKGVTVLQEKGQWIPFNYAADEIQNLGSLWKQLHSSSRNAKKWQELMSASNTPADSKDGNVTDQSLIFVDLTSPQSFK